MRWDSIAKIHGMRFIKTLTFIFLALPVAAKIFLEGNVLPAWMSVSLPFSWGLLYLASLFFFVAMAVYAARCPVIVKDYSGWADFKEREGSYERLIPLVAEVLAILPAEGRTAFIVRHADTKHLRFNDAQGGELTRPKLLEAMADPSKVYATLRRSTCSDDGLADIYASAREDAQRTRPYARATIAAAQTIGFLLLAWVFAQNTWYVFSYYLPHIARYFIPAGGQL